MPETLTATTYVGVTRLAGQIGAEITGADTGTPLSDEVGPGSARPSWTTRWCSCAARA
jgi:hypothetical protein